MTAGVRVEKNEKNPKDIYRVISIGICVCIDRWVGMTGGRDDKKDPGEIEFLR